MKGDSERNVALVRWDVLMLWNIETDVIGSNKEEER